MASNNSTVFKGREAILKAYRFNKVPAWAIFVDRTPMFSYEGDELDVGEDFLAEAVDNLIECLGSGYYQLRVYKVVTEKGILNNTPYNYGFKFALLEDEEWEVRNPGRGIGSLEKRLAALENGGGEEEPEEQDKSFGATLGRVLNRPDVQEFVLQKIFGLVNTVFAPKNPMPAGMAGFTTMDTTQQQQQPPTSAELYNGLPPQEKANFDQAAYILMANDPQVGTNLMKLAKILTENPVLYQSLTKMAG
jgi:hypothetical protein